MMFNKEHIGTSLEEEDILQEPTLAAAKKVIALQISEEMRKKKITKMRMAELMETSRAPLDRALDLMSGNTALETLQRAAKIAGREQRADLV